MTAFRQQKNFALDPDQRRDAREALAKLPDGMTLEEAVRLATRSSGQAVDRKTVRQVAELFIQSRYDDNLRGASVTWYESKLKPIVGQFGADLMDQVTRQRLEAFVSGMRHLRKDAAVSASTKAAHYRAARALWRWAKAQEPALAGRDATEGIRVSAPKQDSTGAEFLTVEEVQTILTNLDARHRPAAALLLFAGIRPQEIAGFGKPPILWRNIDVAGKTIAIEEAIAKTRTRRVLQGLPDAVWAWLGAQGAAESPVSVCTAQQLIRVIQQAGKFSVFKGKGRARAIKTLKPWPHDVTRHTFASYHIAAFDDPGKCALLLGHGGNPRMLYTHYLGLAKREEAVKFWGLRPNQHPQPTPPSGH